MVQLYPQLFSGSRHGMRLLAACVQDELHELGLRMVTDFFELDGWDTYYLGANTPINGIIRMIEEKSVDLLAIDVTMHYHLEKAHRMIDAVRHGQQKD